MNGMDTGDDGANTILGRRVCEQLMQACSGGGWCADVERRHSLTTQHASIHRGDGQVRVEQRCVCKYRKKSHYSRKMMRTKKRTAVQFLHATYAITVHVPDQTW